MVDVNLVIREPYGTTTAVLHPDPVTTVDRTAALCDEVPFHVEVLTSSDRGDVDATIGVGQTVPIDVTMSASHVDTVLAVAGTIPEDRVILHIDSVDVLQIDR